MGRRACGVVLLLAAVFMAWAFAKGLVMSSPWWTHAIAGGTALASVLLAVRRFRAKPNSVLVEGFVVLTTGFVAYTIFVGFSPGARPVSRDLGGGRRVEERRHPNGNPASRMSFLMVDGQEVFDGEETHWYPDGRMHRTVRWVMGKREGLRTTWHPNGRKESEGSYREDRANGIFRRWYPDGKTKSEEDWRDDERHGRSRGWAPDGSLKHDLAFEGGRLLGEYEMWKESLQPRVGEAVRPDSSVEDATRAAPPPGPDESME